MSYAPIIQLEKTGCAIAASAAIAQVSYNQAKQLANQLGIYAEDESLWSDTQAIRQLLAALQIKVEAQEVPFKSWDTLPNLALLATKWHLEKGKPYWHWAVFARDGEQSYVLDSKASLKKHRRTDFGRIRPKWFIPVIH